MERYSDERWGGSMIDPQNRIYLLWINAKEDTAGHLVAATRSLTKLRRILEEEIRSELMSYNEFDTVTMSRKDKNPIEQIKELRKDWKVLSSIEINERLNNGRIEFVEDGEIL